MNIATPPHMSAYCVTVTGSVATPPLHTDPISAHAHTLNRNMVSVPIPSPNSVQLSTELHDMHIYAGENLEK